MNFCSSLSKARPKTMQETRDNIIVDPCSDLPDELIRSYLAVPTYLMELLWNVSPCLGQFKVSSVSLLLSLFLKSIGENMITMIIWFLNRRHSGTIFLCVFPHLSSTDIPFSSYPLKAKYVELMGKDKGYNSNHAYCQVKGWSKNS
jgi:hypothetical protein